MHELDRYYARLLQVGLLVIDQALEAEELDWARAEVQHLHNIPTLINEENVERHAYYWNEERASYIDWLTAHGSEHARSRMRTYYKPIWDAMALQISERLQPVEQP